MLCSSLNNWNYFWNIYYNLPFLAICRSQFPLSLPFHLLSCESWIFMKEEPDRKKKTKRANYVLQHVRTDFWCIMDEELLDSFMTEVMLYRNQYIDLERKSMDWFLYDSDIRHERVNALLLACIHWDIFLDYDKITSMHPNIKGDAFN